MSKTVLIAGGAGFIASHCASLLLESGYQVRNSANPRLRASVSPTEPPRRADFALLSKNGARAVQFNRASLRPGVPARPA